MSLLNLVPGQVILLYLSTIPPGYEYVRTPTYVLVLNLVPGRYATSTYSRRYCGYPDTVSTTKFST
eukprot:SAG31_NODE_32997_length_349_cov_0.784000_1_plen_65_part_10